MGRHRCHRLLLLFLAGLVAISTAQDSCRTPNSAFGSCVNLKECPELLSMLRNPGRNQADLEYVKRSQCGFDRNDPLVCCPPARLTTPTPVVTRPPQTNSQTNNKNNGNNENGPQPGQQDQRKDVLPTDCGRDLSNRIVGGNVTEPDEFPWMALLEYRKANGKMTTACGGVLISKRYVLTAAHCLKGAALPTSWKLLNVRLGEYNTATDPDCIPDGDEGLVCADKPLTVPIEEQIVHEAYLPRSQDQHNDIALLRLAREVRFTNYIKPVCMPRNADLARKFVVAGWGKTETKSESEVKLKVGLPLVDKSACQQKYRDAGVNLVDTQICAGGERNQDSCRGDSGGPLMQQDRDPTDGTQRWAVAGVVSFGPSPCGMLGWPGVYTKVHDFMPWILSKLRL